MKSLRIVICIVVVFASVGITKAQHSDEDLYSAVELLDQGKVEEGLTKLEDFPLPTSLNDSTNFLALMLRTQVNFELYNVKDVVNDIDHLFTILPNKSGSDYIKLLEKHAVSKKYLGEFDDAIADLKEVIELDPSNMKVYSNLAGILIHAKKPKEALKVLHSNPNGIDFAYEFRTAAKAHLMLGNLDSADLFIGYCLQLTGGVDSHIAWLYAAQIMLESGDQKNACFAITEASRIAEAKNIAASYSSFPKTQRKLWVFKNGFKELDEIEKMKAKLCKGESD